MRGTFCGVASSEFFSAGTVSVKVGGEMAVGINHRQTIEPRLQGHDPGHDRTDKDGSSQALSNQDHRATALTDSLRGSHLQQPRAGSDVSVDAVAWIS